MSTFTVVGTWYERGRMISDVVVHGNNLESLLQGLLDEAWGVDYEYTKEELALTTFVVRAGEHHQVVGMFFFETDVPATSLPALIGLGPDTRLSGRWVKGDQVEWHGLYNVSTW